MSSTYKLSYFNITALGEPIRFLLSYGGIDFEDNRIDRAEWPALKSKMPFGQMPILEVDGKTMNQSSAIMRYLAKQQKLAGKDDWQAMEIDAMADNITDLRTKIGQYAYETNETLKAEKLKVLKEETLPFFLEKFDQLAKDNNGYFVGGELSWADIYFVAILDYLNYNLKFNMIEKYPNLLALQANVQSVPGIKKWLENRPKTDF